MYQIEYANKAIEAGTTVVGLQCIDGVIIATEKQVNSKMMLPERRILPLTQHAGCVFTGHIPDGRALCIRG